MCSSPICSEEHLVFLSYFFRIFYKYFRIFKFENEKYRKIPKFLFPVISENEKNTKISAKFDRKVEEAPSAWAWLLDRRGSDSGVVAADRRETK